MKTVTLQLSLYVMVILFASKVNAQPAPSSELEVNPQHFFLKAGYLDGGITKTWATGSEGSFANRGWGITLITQNNWMLSGRRSSGGGESSQKPEGYYPYHAGGGSGGSGSSGGLLNLNISPGSSGSSGGFGSIIKDDCSLLCKEFKITSLLVGKMFNHPFSKPRMSLQCGLTLMQIDEPVDFVLVPGQGYTYTQNQSSKIGPTARIGFEFPVLKYVGLGLHVEGTIAKDERVFGLGVSLMAGFLRGTQNQ